MKQHLCSIVLVAVLLLAVLDVPTASSYVIPSGRHRVAASAPLGGNAASFNIFGHRSFRPRVTRSHSRSRRRAFDLSVNITTPEVPVGQDEQAVIECEAFGPRPALLYWLKNGEKISQDRADGINLIMLEAGETLKSGDVTLTQVKSKLFIDCASIDDEAEYTCVAATPDRVESSTYKLQVSRVPNLLPSASCGSHAKKSLVRRGTPARITMWTHNKLAPTGADVVLVCRAQGSPNAAVTWANDDTQTVINDQEANGRIRILDTGDLEIKDIQWSDMGGYACIAENEVGTDRQVAFLYPYSH